MKRVFIIHGWGNTPNDNWIPWLKKELVGKGFEVHAPEMPNTQNPKLGEWLPFLTAEIGKPNADTYLVGHSMGCQAILRYLENLKDGEIVGGTLLTAPFMTIRKEVMVGDAKEVLGPWVETKLDLKRAGSHSKKTMCIMSDNDPYIPIEDAGAFGAQLGAKVIIIPNAGHFTIEKGGYRELHVALNELLKMIT